MKSAYLLTIAFLPFGLLALACGSSGTTKGLLGSDASSAGAPGSDASPMDGLPDATHPCPPGNTDALCPHDAGADAHDAASVDPACMTIPVDTTRTVHLRITADNECTVFVNGTNVGMTTSWPSPVTIDVSLNVYPGKVNVIGVMAQNTSSQDGNDRGVIGELDDLSDGGTTPVIVTDGSWRTSKVEEAGWSALSFDDSSWAQATVIGNNGDAPWGTLLGTSDAKWIWSAAVPVSTADKPDQETAYFRKVFYFGTDGTTLSDVPGCPTVPADQ